MTLHLSEPEQDDPLDQLPNDDNPNGKSFWKKVIHNVISALIVILILTVLKFAYIGFTAETCEYKALPDPSSWIQYI